MGKLTYYQGRWYLTWVRVTRRTVVIVDCDENEKCWHVYRR